MTTDGLYYLPEGFREGARQNATTADAAEETRRYLGNVTVNTGAYAGANEFPRALTTTRDTQARGVALAAEGRNNMATADRTVAATGEEMDAAAGQTLGGVSASAPPPRPADRGIADAV